jgi:uncharacterized protein YyaL (SSP411 family)
MPLGFASSDNIEWYPYEEGMTLGKIEYKKIFLHFYADWCHYCKVMADETFKDSALISYLNENFISIRVDFDRQSKIVASYGVRGLPSTWFLTEHGEIIGRIPGYISAERLQSMLKEANTAEAK